MLVVVVVVGVAIVVVQVVVNIVVLSSSSRLGVVVLCAASGSIGSHRTRSLLPPLLLGRLFTVATVAFRCRVVTGVLLTDGDCLRDSFPLFEQPEILCSPIGLMLIDCRDVAGMS